jgi:hypothetical protein
MVKPQNHDHFWLKLDMIAVVKNKVGSFSGGGFGRDILKLNGKEFSNHR